MPALSPGPSAQRDFLASIPHRPLTLLRALRLNSAHGFSSPNSVVLTSSLLRLFCFHALTNCKFHNSFLFTTIQNAGVCTPLALSCLLFSPRVRHVPLV